MKAVRVHQYGTPEGFTLDEVPQPVPGAGKVLVRVRAAGVNPIDWKIRAGYMKEVMPLPLPVTLGFDFSGEIEALGEGVTHFKKGDPVYGTAMGTFAEFVVTGVAEAAPKPASLDYVHAASVPVAAKTAWQALFDVGGLTTGGKVLIHGAAGSVGSFAVQLARAKGIHVYGTASSGNQAYLKELGVDEPINYQTTKFEDVAHDIDVVLDTQGGETQQRSFAVLKKGGTLVSIVQPPSQDEAAKYGVKATFLGSQPNLEQLTEIARLIDAGQLKTVVEAVMPLEDAGRALDQSQTGHARGKIVLTVG
ncbi:MAG TPA: NADP-dependent oxidoreductase [Terracidiphilus sp.]|jgi:NADPH:quinone reductase-like Zn-dependent oxidoreductase